MPGARVKVRAGNFKPRHIPRKVNVQPKYVETGQAALMAGGHFVAAELAQEVLVPAAVSVCCTII